MEGPSLRLDHLRLAVPDLDAAAATLDALGFATIPAAAPGWLGLALPFERVEFEGAAAPALRAVGLSREADRPAANDAVAPTREVVGDVRLAFAEEPLAAAELPLVLARTLTPAALRPPSALRHPNGAVGLASATVLVADPDGLARALAELLGDAAITRTDAIVALRLPRRVLVFARAADAELLHPDLPALPPDPVEAPRAVALGFDVTDATHCAALLDARGAAPRRRPDGSCGVTAPALGLALEFHAPG